jgi:hypothetical protein
VARRIFVGKILMSCCLLARRFPRGCMMPLSEAPYTSYAVVVRA